MKRIIYLFLLTILFKSNINIISKENDRKYYIIDSPFLKFLDGVTGRMDGYAIEEVIIVRKAILDGINGILCTKGAGKNQELVKFNGKHVTIKELCELENKLGRNNPELLSILNQLKDCFINTSLPFMHRIEPAKNLVIKIMEKSCKIRGIAHKDTILMEWAKTPFGAEKAMFNDHIKSFEDFNKFLHQVHNFLGDFLRSCPIAFDHYKKIKNKK